MAKIMTYPLLPQLTAEKIAELEPVLLPEKTDIGFLPIRQGNPHNIRVSLYHIGEIK